MVSRGKDLAALKAPLGAAASPRRCSRRPPSAPRTGARDWTFGTVERVVQQTRAGHQVRGYPALVDEGDAVGLRVFGSEADQQAAHRLGVRRLLALALPSPAARLTAGWDNRRKLALAGSPYPTVGALLDDCVLAAVGALMDRHAGPACRARRGVLPGAPDGGPRRPAGATAADVLDDAVRVLEAWRATDRALSGSVDLRCCRR